jgi:hypothetical protein
VVFITAVNIRKHAQNGPYPPREAGRSGAIKSVKISWATGGATALGALIAAT